jgi:hypothetical protein
LRQIKASASFAAMMRPMARQPADPTRPARLRRGLFRLWLVLSAAFVVAVAWHYFDAVRTEFDRAQLMYKMGHDRALLPMECNQARGLEDKDYTRAQPSHGELYRLRPNQATCWYAPDRLRALYPEYAGTADQPLAQKLYSAVGIPLQRPPAPFTLGLRVALLAIGAPLLALALGSGLLWAMGGFLRQRD